MKSCTGHSLLQRAPPLLLLSLSGTLLAIVVALSKVARQHGVPPLAVTFWMTLGAGLLLTPMLARAPGGRWREKLRYGLIAGALGRSASASPPRSW